MRNISAVLTLFLFAACCRIPAPGVSKDLAQSRSQTISGLVYHLQFDLPDSKDARIPAHETIDLVLEKNGPIVLDFRESKDLVGSVSLNGKPVKAKIENEHILIEKGRKGSNTVSIEFFAGEQSLNRRDELMYTLLVPDRARTLFPCFDQPDLKAQYELTLSVPKGWTAVSNSPIASQTLDSTRSTISFGRTEPLSTYLFSFVAGIFECYTQDGISMYYRETDPQKLSQREEIVGMVKSSLEYMEKWTGIAYPFSKYDFIVLPDFQYGGMEHTGATLYNDRRIFLEQNPTADELLGRASLIAHETAHMWFGDYLTMRWFDDVWTKEVFANWMAAQMARPSFPEVNHTLADLASLYAPSYKEDRTSGSNAIYRPLDNLSDAGLIYCNIIYDKAPVMLDKLQKRMGAEEFRQGVCDYLKSYAYSNASWDDLVASLQSHASFDVEEWSRVWVKERGMPVYKAKAKGNELTVRQFDPFPERFDGNGRALNSEADVWQQSIQYTLVLEDGSEEVVSVDFTGSDTVVLCARKPIRNVLPNTDGLGYGCFRIYEKDSEFIRSTFPRYSAQVRMSLLMTLYEHVIRGYSDAKEFAEWASEMLEKENDALILSAMMNYAVDAERIVPSHKLEKALLSLACDIKRPMGVRMQAFRKLFNVAQSAEINALLYVVWEKQVAFAGIKLGETDQIALCYELMLRYPDRYEKIVAEQRSRILNKDRREAFDFVCRAATPSQEARDAVFESLLDPSNRRPESRALDALALLFHPLRSRESLKYIRPALEELPRIQRTGDIFFPASWCSTLLRWHFSTDAEKEVRAYLDANPDLNPLLKTKVLQACRF